MDNLGKYIKALKEGIEYLSLPIELEKKKFITKEDGQEIKLIYSFQPYFLRKEGEEHVSCAHYYFMRVLGEYVSKYEVITIKCRKLRPEVILDELLKCSLHLDFHIKLYLETLKKEISTLLIKTKSVENSLAVYQEAVDHSHIVELKICYNFFMITWRKLLETIIDKECALQSILTNAIDNNKTIKLPKEIETFSINVNLTFPKKFSFMAAKEIHSLLIKNSFIDSSTTLSDLCCVFSVACGEEEKERCKPIRWIKQNSKVGNKKINRTSLIDFLTLLGYKQKDIIGEEGGKYKRLNNCFQVGNHPFKANDFTPGMKSKNINESLKVESEFHKALVEMLSKVSLPKNS